jgi:hypothetical protein
MLGGIYLALQLRGMALREETGAIFACCYRDDTQELCMVLALCASNV